MMVKDLNLVVDHKVQAERNQVQIKNLRSVNSECRLILGAQVNPKEVKVLKIEEDFQAVKIGVEVHINKKMINSFQNILTVLIILVIFLMKTMITLKSMYKILRVIIAKEMF